MTNISVLTLELFRAHLGIWCQRPCGLMVCVSGASWGGTRTDTMIADERFGFPLHTEKLLLHQTTPLSSIYDARHIHVRLPQLNIWLSPQHRPWAQTMGENVCLCLDCIWTKRNLVLILTCRVGFHLKVQQPNVSPQTFHGCFYGILMSFPTHFVAFSVLLQKKKKSWDLLYFP